MPGGVNRTILVGVVGKYGVEVRYANSGTPVASFMLACSEQWQDGTTHDLYIPCEIVGKKAEAAGELDAGTLVLFEGKLAKRKKGEQWELVVSGFAVTPVLAPTPTLTGTTTGPVPVRHRGTHGGTGMTNGTTMTGQSCHLVSQTEM